MPEFSLLLTPTNCLLIFLKLIGRVYHKLREIGYESEKDFADLVAM
jgi:hypothetical protein